MTGSARTAPILITELAVAVVLAAAVAGPVALAVAAPVAAGLAAAAWARPGGRRPHEWLGVALRHRRARPPDVLAGPPHTVTLPPPPGRPPHPEEDGERLTAVDDEHGLTVVLELGDPDALIAPAPAVLPHPADFPRTRAHVQLVLMIEPAPAPSYRAMTEVPARLRALLAVRVPHRPGRDTARDLHGALRAARTALGDLPHRPLDGAGLHRACRDIAGTDRPLDQAWTHLRTPGQMQSVFRVPGDHPPVAELARLAATRVTLAVTASGTLLQIAAPDGPPVVAGAQRLDGGHLDALTAVLPLARVPHLTDARAPHLTDARAARTTGARGLRTDRRPVPLPRDGLFLGRDRAGEAVVIRPFRRAAPVSIAVVGGVRGAQLLVLRALATGAVVLVRTAHPHAWAPLLRAADPAGTVARLTGEPADHPGRRVLEVLDRVAGPGPYRHSTLRVVAELTPETAATVARADLLLLQHLPAGPAAVAERHLGLGRAAGWLTRIGPGMFALVGNGALRWVEPSPTGAETRLLEHALP